MLASFPVPPPEGACVLTGCIADAPRTEGGFTYATLYDAACNGNSVRGRIQIRFPAEKAKGLKCGDIISIKKPLSAFLKSRPVPSMHAPIIFPWA